MTKKRYAGPTAGDRVEAYLRLRGIRVDGERLEERAAAERQRAKLDDAAAIEETRSLGDAVKRLRRQAELEEWAWRRNPCSETLERAKSAQAARNSGYAELLEACLQDQDLASRLSR